MRRLRNANSITSKLLPAFLWIWAGVLSCLPKICFAEDIIYEEIDGVVAVEAENHTSQTKTENQSWFVRDMRVKTDSRFPLLPGYSGDAYLEALPWNRYVMWPGVVGVLSYRVYINNPGRYYLWVRAAAMTDYSDSINIGFDNQWIEGEQYYSIKRKKSWAWSNQISLNGNVQNQLSYNFKTKGVFTIHFSIRETGVAFDKWMLINEKVDDFVGIGPEPIVKSGVLPTALEIEGLTVKRTN